jgi:hypothetical protein
MFIPFNSTGSFDLMDGKYNGAFQAASSIGAPKSKHIFSNTAIVMASSVAKITNSCGNNIAVALGGSTNCTITVSDDNNGSMPVGTKVTFAYTDKTTGITLTASNYTFTNSTPRTGATLDVTLTDDGAAPLGRGTLTVNVESPSGILTPPARYNVN